MKRWKWPKETKDGSGVPGPLEVFVMAAIAIVLALLLWGAISGDKHLSKVTCVKYETTYILQPYIVGKTIILMPQELKACVEYK